MSSELPCRKWPSLLARLLFWAVVSSPFGVPASAIAQKSGSACNHPVLFDRFSKVPFDSTNWVAVNGKQQQGANTRSADLETYKPQSIGTGPDGLYILADRSHMQDDTNSPYVSGRLQSKRAFRYGYFEFRARLPEGRGLWPAIWLRTPPGTPFNGEIDILEGYGSKPYLIQSTLHPWKNGIERNFYCALLSTEETFALSSSKCERVIRPLQDNFSESFHTFALLWQPDKITWMLDGKPYFETSSEIPDQPMIIVISLQISASHDGYPDGTLVLPQQLSVQYAKVCN